MLSEWLRYVQKRARAFLSVISVRTTAEFDRIETLVKRDANNLKITYTQWQGKGKIQLRTGHEGPEGE